FLKNPNRPHWGFEARYLGEDEYGWWMAVPAGTRRWKGETPARPSAKDAVFCAPHDDWWHLHYNGGFARNYSHFVDITTPPTWVSDDRYEMIDLDLDVAVHVDGSIEIQDEDEFEVHQVQYGYTPEMIANAVRETAQIVERLQARHEPFFDVAEHWLARVAD
ncbi:MAG TPA: DUF402 domain-containing protein, partial [Acidimicrobiia bacterium]|nr:DUF402 domain-containing protein [Acidimicrobiia bacterium]